MCLGLNNIRNLLAIVVVLAAQAVAQVSTATLLGTVKDATRALIPSAKLTLIHIATARQYTTQTNEVGFFLFPSIPASKTLAAGRSFEYGE